MRNLNYSNYSNFFRRDEIIGEIDTVWKVSFPKAFQRDFARIVDIEISSNNCRKVG